MPLTKLQFRPGVNREYTSYSNEGGWWDGDKIRFHLGFPEKIGGWQKYSANTFQGTARRLHNWVGLDGSDFMGVGTTVKYYIPPQNYTAYHFARNVCSVEIGCQFSQRKPDSR